MVPVISTVPALAAAAILSTDRKIVQRLRSAQAIDAARAVPFDPPGPLGRSRLRRLVSVGAVGVAGGRDYRSEQGYAAWRTVRRNRGVAGRGVLLSANAVMAAVGIISFF
jgi:hypothetical protein